MKFYKYIFVITIITAISFLSIPGVAGLKENIPENGWPYKIIDQLIYKNIFLEDPSLYKRGYILDRKQMALVIMRLLSNIKLDTYHSKLTKYDIKQIAKLVHEFEDELEYLFNIDISQIYIDLNKEIASLKPNAIIPSIKTKTLYYELSKDSNLMDKEDKEDNKKRFSIGKINFKHSKKLDEIKYPDSFNTPVTISVRNANIKDILLATFKKINTNIIIEKDLNKIISLQIKNTPIKKLMKTLENYGVYNKEINGMYHFYSSDKFSEANYKLKYLHTNERELTNWLSNFRSTRGRIKLDPKTNTVFIKDSEKNIKKIISILNKEDVENEETKQITKTLNFKYINADDMKKTINNQFKKINIISSKTNNSLIITSNYKEMKEILKICQTFDVKPESSKKITRIYRIEYAEAAEILTLLKDKSISNDMKNLDIAIDKRTNSLIITTSKENLNKIEEFISVLDSPSKQVHIETKIIEVNLSNSDSFGFKWKALLGNQNIPHYSDDIQDSSSSTSSTEETFKNPSFNRLNINLSDVENDNDHQFSLGTLTKDQFNVLLNSLKTKTKTNILSSPSITTINGKKATLDISEDYTIVYPGGKDQQGQQTNEKENVNFGIKLNVTPIITDEGTIKLAINQEISNLVGYHDNYPIKAKRSLDTNVILKNGNTLMIAGLIQKQKVHKKEKIPLLSEIPIIGRLFKKSTTEDSKKETVIFITPKIIQSQKLITNN